MGVVRGTGLNRIDQCLGAPNKASNASAALLSGLCGKRSLNDGRNLYLLATGTSLAPFMSIICDPDTYERFDKVVLVQGRLTDLMHSGKLFED